MPRDRGSQDSLAEASRSRGEFSGHGPSKGMAGTRTDYEILGNFLKGTGDTAIVDPRAHGFGPIRIGASWDNTAAPACRSFLQKLLKPAAAKPPGVDIDLGCLYELQDGQRGCVQAFGERTGDYEQPPFIALSGDERTGDKKGYDEHIRVNGVHWPDIKRILIYVYIYGGAINWAHVKPRVRIFIPGEDDLIAAPSLPREELPVCTVAEIENIRNGMKIKNCSEYFAGHAEMDRAFGYGISWTDGRKSGE